MDVRWLLFAGLVAWLPAQQRVSARVEIVACGAGCAADVRARTLTSREQLVELLEGLSWPGEVPDIDCQKRTVRFLPLGEGRAGEIRVTQFARGDDFLIRLEGEPAAATVIDRWVVVRFDPRALRTADLSGAESDRRMLFETDQLPIAGDPTFRLVEPGPPVPMAGGISISATTVGWVPESEDPLCLTDAIAFAEFVRRYQNQETPVQIGQLHSLARQMDFGAGIVLVRPVDRTGMMSSVSSPIAFFYTHSRLAGARTMVRGNLLQQPEPYLGVYLLPRVNGTLDYELPVPGRYGLMQRVAQFPIEDPATAPVMPVLRLLHKDIDNRAATTCTLATTPSEWRALRRELDEFRDLPDTWCDFTTASVLAIAVEAGRVWPGFQLRVTEEEGVDVLTAIQTAPSGRDPGMHSYAVLAVVPKRPAQLAVVLRLECGPAPGTEKTLRVFPATGR